MCPPKHIEQLRNIGIINSTTRLHLVCSFCEFYITMHGSMNIKLVSSLVYLSFTIDYKREWIFFISILLRRHFSTRLHPTRYSTTLGPQRNKYRTPSAFCYRNASLSETQSAFLVFDVHGSVHRNTNRIEITNKMRPCSIIYYFNVSYLLNMFRATHHSSSGAQKL